MFTENNNCCKAQVQRRPDPSVKRTAMIYLIIAVLAALITFLLRAPHYLVATGTVLVLRGQLLNKAHVTLEYQFSDRKLDVDCIYKNKKRKRIASYRMEDVEIFAREGDPALKPYPESDIVQTRFLIGNTAESETQPIYEMYVRQEGGILLVQFQPSEEMVQKITENFEKTA